MRLMSYPEGSKIKKQTHINKTVGHFWKNGVGCPIGTVPILLVSKEALLKMKSFDGDNSNPQSSWSKTYKPTSSCKCKASGPTTGSPNSSPISQRDKVTELSIKRRHTHKRK